jgi:hypothetical protein
MRDTSSPEGRRGTDADGASPEVVPGGDPVCWLSRVCPECGLFVEGALPAVCARCGASVVAGDEAE